MGRPLKDETRQTRAIMFQLDLELWNTVVLPTCQRDYLSYSDYFRRLVEQERDRINRENGNG